MVVVLAVVIGGGVWTYKKFSTGAKNGNMGNALDQELDDLELQELDDKDAEFQQKLEQTLLQLQQQHLVEQQAQPQPQGGQLGGGQPQ